MPSQIILLKGIMLVQCVSKLCTPHIITEIIDETLEFLHPYDDKKAAKLSGQSSRSSCILARVLYISIANVLHLQSSHLQSTYMRMYFVSWRSYTGILLVDYQ